MSGFALFQSAIGKMKIEKQMTEDNELTEFDAIVRKVFSVSRAEISKREQEYQRPLSCASVRQNTLKYRGRLK